MTASLLQTGLLPDAPNQGDLGELVDARSPAREQESLPRAARVYVAQVYEAHVDYVFRCLRSLGVRDGHVEDAVQDVFLVVHDKLHAFDGAAQLRTWLYAIVIRVARRYRERQARDMHSSAAEPIDPRCAEHRLLSLEALDLARLALEALSDEKREVFVMAEIEQMSAPQIAAITFAPLNTVYSRLRAARLEFDRRVEQLTRERQGRLR
jgi:RNA polymerase sigma-70 factor (ECF subfamily)